MASIRRWLDIRRYPWKKDLHYAGKQWRIEHGMVRLSRYPGLSENAVVFDLGGYEGGWTAKVLESQPNCIVHIFEPHPRFAGFIRKRYETNPRIHVHEFALGSQSGTMHLSDAADGSSLVTKGDKDYEVKVVAVDDFFQAHDIPRIDLMKMNIEGGEYDLLPCLIENGLMPRITRLQVQFHLFERHFIEMRDEIRNKLNQTHECLWVYPFVFEEWYRRPS